jgi:hypothetical protein
MSGGFHKKLAEDSGYPLGYNESDFFLETEVYRPFDGCKIEI